MRAELFSQSRNDQRAQCRVSLNRLVLGVLKQIVWQVKSSLSSHLTNGQDTVIKALKQYHNRTISAVSLGLSER